MVIFECTKQEAEEIKKLICKIRLANRAKQKSLRQKLRSKFGFFINKFHNGFNEIDLENEITLGSIKIIGSKTPVPIVKSPKVKTTETIKHQFKEIRTCKCFNPLKDSESSIPDCSGNYIIVLGRDNSLPIPKGLTHPILSTIEVNKINYQVIYTGISKSSMRKRDYKQHFNGNGGSSTLRKSLGCLFGYQLIPRTAGVIDNKSRFCDKDEQELSKWMKSNLMLLFMINKDYSNLENELIESYNPPLNLDKNRNIINIEFRKLLSSLRSSKNINCKI